MTLKNKLLSYIKTILTFTILIISNIIAIFFLDYTNSDFTIGPIYNAVIILISFSILNSILWPVFRRFLMKFIILTFGIGGLFINSSIFYMSTSFIPGVYVGFYAFWQVPIIIAIVTTLITNITNINYFDSYIERIFKHSHEKKAENKSYSGIIMLEIDGLSINTLKKAIDNDIMPTLKNWIANTHTLKEWETDLSSQTGASQAGILHGNNEDIVAYRWVEKENDNKIVVSASLNDSPKIEKQISNGKGLLVNGISIANIFSGDSKLSALTSSKFKNMNRIHNKTLHSIFIDSYNFQRIFTLFLWDIVVEISSQIIHRVKNIQPRLRNSIIYPAIRAGANVVLREATTEILASEIFRGEIDTAYATFMGYDEVAHHSGVEDRDVWGVLKKIDQQISRLKSAVEMGDRDYQLVILSDHGQSNGATFKQRYGVSLRNYVRQLLPDDLKVYKEEYNIYHFRDAVFVENKQIKNIKQQVEHIHEDLFDENNIFQNKKIFKTEQFNNLVEKYADSLEYITGHEISQYSTKKAKDSELIVLGSGNLGLIYLTQWKERLTYEEIVILFPDLIPNLVNHPGIGFILVDSIINGGMVIGQNGIHYLETGKIIGQNPLENFGKNASQHLKRQNHFNHMPDILVNSFYDEKSDEVCAFEELIGSHGGLGGNQTKAFILYPKEWKDPGELIGAESIYYFLKKEIDKLKS